MSVVRRPLVAAYYFPNFHVDPRNEAWHGAGWTEWDLARRATPRFDGHRQPRVPLLGYQDEADPEVMRSKIDMARDHGVDAFLFDWYWYDGRPYLERPLESAFMPATTVGDVQFAVMWANHHWSNIHPWKSATPVTELESGSVDAGQFTAATDYLLQRYLAHPAYLRIDGRPYLSIYDLATLVAGLGGLAATRAALDDLRLRAARAGHPGLHLNAIGWEQPVLPQDGEVADIATLVEILGFDSVTSYVWVHHHSLPTLQTPYAEIAAEAAAGWEDRAAAFAVPYFPNVTVGWDPSPRTVQSDRYDPRHGYPHTNTLAENTPEQFGRALHQARRFAVRTEAPLVTINAWNEWTEGSYLEPDTVHGFAYLQEILRVYGRRVAAPPTAAPPFVPVVDARPDDQPWATMAWPVRPDVTLQGDTVELTPVDPDRDAVALFEALDHDAVWQHVAGRPATPDDYAETLRAAAVAGRLPWLVRLLRPCRGLGSGAVVGTSSYLDVAPADARLEIGWTTYTPAVWGSPVNPETKLLLLTHAFDVLGVGRVQLKTDARNIRSQRAISALGARSEGLLRRYQRRADGTVRDTVMFSVISEDWPSVRAGLQARLGRDA